MEKIIKSCNDEELELLESCLDLDRLKIVLKIIDERIETDRENKEKKIIRKVSEIFNNVHKYLYNIDIICCWKEVGKLQDETRSYYFNGNLDDDFEMEYSLKFDIQLEYNSDKLYIKLDLSVKQKSYCNGDKIYFWTESIKINNFEHNFYIFFPETKYVKIIEEILYLSDSFNPYIVENILNYSFPYIE